MAAEVEIGAADGVVAGDGHQLLELLPIEELPAKAPRLSDLRPAPGQRELGLAQGDADPIGLVLRGIAEELVHLRPEALLLEAEGTVDVGGAAAIAAGGFPAHDALLEHEHVHARSGQPPSGAEPGDTTADDDHRRPLRLLHRRGYRDVEPAGPYVCRPYSRFLCQRRLSDPNRMCLDMSGENRLAGGRRPRASARLRM